MFFNQKATDVPGILEEGRSWIDRLETAAVKTAEEADDLEAAAALMIQDAANTREIADEGQQVADNFKKLLVPRS